MKEYSGIIFDLDGTLYEKNKMGLKMIINKPFDARRIKASRTVLKNLEGSFFKTGDAFLEKYYTLLAEKIKTNITNAKKWEQESFYKNFISILKKTKPRQGIEELIKSFHCPCIILSDYAMIDERLKALNINPELFSHRLYSGDLGGLKPSSEVFLRASEIMECKPETILVIGDDPQKDGNGAQSAGMDFYLADNSSWLKLKTMSETNYGNNATENKLGNP